MRKPLLTQTFSFLACNHNPQKICRSTLAFFGIAFISLLPIQVIGQCQTNSGQIEGMIFNDHNYDGQQTPGEQGTDLVKVHAYDKTGQLVAEVQPDNDGSYIIDGLTDGDTYRINIELPVYLKSSVEGSDNLTATGFVEAPHCGVNFAVANPVDYCQSPNPDVAVTCFVRGGTGVNDDMPTVVYAPYLFNQNSAISKIAKKGETGSVFGTAWKASTQELFLASFVKQDAFLKDGLGAIYVAKRSQGQFTTQLWAKLGDLGIDAGQSNTNNAENCDYGAQVGKIGIGGIELSHDESLLFVVNLWSKSVVVIDANDPDPSTTMEIPFPMVNCQGGQLRPFAVRHHEGQIYISATCDASDSRTSADHKIAVFTLDYDTKSFTHIFSTSFTRKYWQDSPPDNSTVSHWLTDIEFTDQGHMILGIADRQSHRFCDATPLAGQYPDILMAWNDNGTWKLENNGKVGSLTGSGVGNGQGPGGGEFFGEDYWILGPNYHPEIATGAVFVLPGSDEVVSTVFDPIYSTSSGGFHRYSTINGKKTAAIELYTNNNNVAFGKGSGLGNVIDMCDPAPVQIGNLVWMDENKNGIQDPGEEVVEGLEISLVNTNCEAVEVTTTGSKGEYYFDTGLDYHSSYYVVITDPRYDVSSERLVIDGEELTATIANSGNGIFQNENDSDGTLISGNGCQLLDGHLAIEVQTSGPGYVNHSFDLGLTTEEVIIQQPDTFDLALMKEVVGNDPVKLGQMVDYEITVFNQGQVAASEIQIVEYLPAGLEFSAILNPGWIYQHGELTFTHMGIVDPGSSIKVNITLQITEAADLDDYINYSEISSALDANGDPVQDIDSKPDMIVSNDKGGEPNGPTDNLYDDDGTIDEDDHDPAMVKIFDLALIKTTDFNQTIKIGDEIEFEIEVFNQGQIPATEIEIVDYLPQGLTLSANDNNGWSLVQQGVISTIPGMVNPGESITKSILLEVTGDAQPGQVINFAEISAARDDQGQDMSAFDFDSSPDKEVDNDIGGEPNGPTDNVYNDNGLIDEDDHDPAKLQIYDLALIKSVDKVNVTSTDEDITFHFEIINQGEIATDRVDIVDHIPNGYSFSANDNPNWLKVNSEMLRAALTSSLEPGERAVIPLVLRLSNDGLGKELINYGEIASSVDAFNGQGRDFDSTSDLDKDNDAGGQVNTATDNMINGNGVTDEDDHDPAVIQGVEPMLVDVSLTKTVNTTHVVAGEEVGFTFEITNEEETAIGEIRIVDYLPFFLENIDPEWTLSPNGLYIYKDLRAGDGLPQEGLMNGEIVTTTLQTRILDGIPPGPILNTAEIARLEPYSQNVVAFHDVDSQPDDDPNNDRSNNPKEVIGGAGNDNRPIEDDRAADEVVVCQIERTNICTCLNNESNENNGQFLETVVVTSASGETWYVQEANDIYRDNSPNPPSPPIPFDNGDMLTENTLGGGISTYSISGVFEEGTEWYMIVRNNFDAIHSIQGGQECEYEHPAIIGANSVCINGIEEYEIIPARQGAVYDWNLGSGGSFISGTSGPRVKVQWDDAVSGPHRLTAEEISPDNCTAPATMEVEIGDQFVYSVSCVQEAQISLGNNCVSRVTPQMLLTGGPYDYEAFNVMLSDEHGHPIPDATLTHEHIGKRIMAKVINACTGNSCWAWLTVEDKIGPEIICFNDTVICASMGKYPFPVAIDACDPDPTVRLLNESTEPIDCDPEFIKRVTRRYIAEDQWGNVSDTCVQEIMLRRINTDSIDYPDTFSIANGNPLICNSFKADSNGLPLPEVTGVPMYGDISLWPEEFYCSIGVDYEDIELHRVGCVRKFVREWKIVEWYCTSGFNLIRYPQYIEITDTVAPEVVCPDVEYIVTNTRSCDADVWLDLPEVTDNCSDSFRIDLTYPGGFIKNYKGGKITLPVDTNLIKFRVYDECFNVDSCEFEVIVQDNTPPVAICDQFTTVGLTDTGIAYIYARTFDDGSYDNCKLKTMEVKRMDEGLNCGVVADTFGPYVEFCCEDAGQDVMVIFRVTDKSGNSNTCMVEVEVQDKIPPRIYCPPNDTISCEYHYDTSDLSEFGAPVILDNCEFTLEERVVENVDQCREGYIDRIFIARDENNVSTCVQRIYIINETPFTEDDITWPLDLDTTECREGFLTPDLLPDPYGYPRVEEDICDLVGITFTDHTFPFVDNTEACYKILRKWKIINWCRFDSSEYDTWTYEQVIKVQNETAPVITSSCDKIEKCIYDDCEFGFIELFATATDDCTDESELRWEYHVDLDSDGITDYSDEGFGPRIDIAREFRLGEHNVRFVFEDQCGNKTVCTQFFDLINCKAPSAYCKNGIVVDLIPMDLDGDGECDTEMVEIWARDLDANSFHPCDYPLTYSIGRDTSNKSIIYDCDDLGRREIEICVTTPKGHQSCCNTFVIVQDNNQVSCCPTSIDKDCIIPPADVNLTDCNTSTDPDDLMSFPMTSNCAVDSVVRSFEDEDGTTGDVCQKIIRTWTVELYAGGIDTVCQFTHCIVIDNEFTINDIIWPADTLMLQDCEVDLDTSATGGTPVILGDYCDYVTVDWSDVELVDPDPACRTFQRTWSVVNACENNETFTFEQILEYRNQAPPTLTVPGNITVNSDPGVCEAFVTLPPVEFTECNTGVIVVNDHNGGGANASGVYPVGTTVVTFSASDDCDNVSQATLIVVVEDNEPPTLRCPANMTFDCGQDLEDLDFGDPVASDNCDGVEILMDTIFNLNSCNIGTITRNVIAQDTSGNGAVCVQTITIENMDPFVEGDIDWPEDTVMLSVCDSTGPEFTGEPVIDTSAVSCFNITVTFEDTMFMDICDGEPCTIIERLWTVTDSCQLDGQGGGIFTFLQVLIIDGMPLTITCPSDTTITCEEGLGDLSQYGEFSAESECGIVSEVLDTIYDLNVCDVGTVTRTYMVEDSSGTILTCQQVITVVIDEPFTEDRIMWPEDSVIIGSCDSVTMTGEPEIDTSGLSCFRISVMFEDSMYVDTCDGEPCDVTRRKWTVIDSCQLDGMGGGIYCDTQIIVKLGEVLEIMCPADTLLDCTEMLGDLSNYGTLTFSSPCGVDTVIRDTIYELNACSLGTVTRSLFVRDTAGNEVMCTQVITVGTDDPFMEEDINWPPDSVFVDNCTSIHPDSLMNGRPVIDSSALECARLSITYSDSSSASCEQSPCLVVFRDWTVTDSCQLDSLGAGVFMFRQVIEVEDTIPPVITNVPDDTLVVPTDSSLCEAMVSLVAGAMDCSPNVMITNDSPHADSSGADASGIYPLGVTSFFFYAEDECCNRDSVMVNIEVIDTVAPRIRCTKVFKTMFDSIEGVKFFADEPISAFADNCTQEGDFKASFSLDDMSDTCRFYNCDSLRMTGLPNLLYRETVYVWDESGNVDSCEALLQVVDSSGCIDKSFGITVTGLVMTENLTQVKDATIDLKGSNNLSEETDDDGIYIFSSMPAGGTYVIAPEKDGDDMNGVTTKDLVYIQRHLLGKQELPTPYQRIAADVNDNDDISVRDLVELRRMLLGYYQEFPNNTSWRFVDAEYVFPDPRNPWIEEFPETYLIDPLERNMNVDFTAVKIGDVTGDVSFFDGENRMRDKDRMIIEYEIVDNEYRFYKVSDPVINSFQLTLNWIAGDEVQVVLDEKTPLSDDDIGYHSLDEGIMTIASDDMIPEGRVYLFSLKESSVLGGLHITSDVTPVLAYNEVFEPLRIEMVPSVPEQEAYKLYQNKPNPFRGSTVIGFEVPGRETVRLSVLNMNGQVIVEKEGVFDRGYNEVEILNSELHGSGIYYYRLDCQGYSKILKMINID